MSSASASARSGCTFWEEYRRDSPYHLSNRRSAMGVMLPLDAAREGVLAPSPWPVMIGPAIVRLRDVLNRLPPRQEPAWVAVSGETVADRPDRGPA